MFISEQNRFLELCLTLVDQTKIVLEVIPSVDVHQYVLIYGETYQCLIIPSAY